MEIEERRGETEDHKYLQHIYPSSRIIIIHEPRHTVSLIKIHINSFSLFSSLDHK